MMCLKNWRGAACVGVAVVVGLTGCTGYHPNDYAGDGTMTAAPKAAPRYDVELGQISLAGPSRMEFRLDELPSENLLALIVLDEPTPEKQAWVDAADTRVTMTLTDGETGRVSTKSGLLVGEWSKSVESWSGDKAEFEGIWFRSARHARFTLVVEVTIDHPQLNAPKLSGTVHVRGGGFGTY